MDELIEHHEWDKLLSMLEKVADDNDEDGVDSSSESWSILLFSFCQAVITGGMTNTATKTKTSLDDDDDIPSTRSTAPSSSSTSVSKLDYYNNITRRRHSLPPLPSTVSSIISNFVRISSKSCIIIDYANEVHNSNHAARKYDNKNTILHCIVNLIVDVIESYAGYFNGKEEEEEVHKHNTYDIHRSIDKCLVIIHTLTSIRPELLLMTNDHGQTPLICLLSSEMTTASNIVVVDDENGIGNKLQQLIKALMVTKDDDDDDDISTGK